MSSILSASASTPGALAPMRSDWDYSALAANYDARPGYAAALLDRVFAQLQLGPGRRVLDVGAGTGALTAALCVSGAEVVACEPNPQMRAIGAAKPTCAQAHWLAARGEALPLCESSVDLLGYGSSFNVLDPSVALVEAVRVLRRGGHWLALWNHRDTEDPLQAEVERCIRRQVPGYRAGARREDPRPLVRESGLFEAIDADVERFEVEVKASEWLRAWQAHATLRRQAGTAFARVLADIAHCVQGAEVLRVPYHTRAYRARRR